MSRYDTDVDAGNQNTSHGLMLELVGYNKRVLDVGCSTGYLARAMTDRGCTVSGVEFDAAAAEEARPWLERLVVGDLEALDLEGEFGSSLFDAIVFGDVLEHLRDPLPVLRQARGLLRPGGFVVISLPNIAHGSVRLSLLLGRFEYTEVGLLDSTHLRFFTRESCLDLLSQAGLIGVDVRRTTVGIFETEPIVRREEVPPEVLQSLLDDPDATTYQFVIRAIPDDGDTALRSLTEQVDRFRRRTHDLERTIDVLAANRDELKVAVDDERSQRAAVEVRARAAQELADDLARQRDELSQQLGELRREHHELTRERNELGRIAHDEREKHLAAEQLLERRLTRRLTSLIARSVPRRRR